MKTLYHAAFMLAVASSAAQAATIYTEDFSGEQGLGAIGGSVDTAGADWTVATGDASLFNDQDFLAVTGDEKFTFRDTNAGCSVSSCAGDRGTPLAGLTLPMWLSPVIDISNLTNLAFAADVSGSGGYETSGGVGVQDSFVFDFLIDGVSQATVDIMALLSSLEVDEGFDFALNGSLFSGNELIVKVTGNTYAAGENFSFDNLSITGGVAAVPLPAAGVLLLGALGAMGLRRKS